jgi:hypothetical protein
MCTLHPLKEADLHTLKNTRGARRTPTLTRSAARPGLSHFPFPLNLSPPSVISDDPFGECSPIRIFPEFRRRNLGEKVIAALQTAREHRDQSRSGLRFFYQCSGHVFVLLIHCLPHPLALFPPSLLGDCAAFQYGTARPVQAAWQGYAVHR